MFASILATEQRRQRGRLIMACLAAGGLGTASALLPALSGWFISGAALAGAAGSAAATGFNTLLPSAGIRLLAILRTGSRYGERLSGHDAALRVMARVRPSVFIALAALPPACALAVSAGDAAARVTNDVDEVEAGLIRRPASWTVAASVLACITALSVGSYGMIILAMSAVLVVGSSAVMLARAGSAQGEEVTSQTGLLKEGAMRLLSARAELRAYGLEDWAAVHIAERSAALAAAQRRANAAPMQFELVAAVVSGGAVMGALALGASQSLPVVALSALGVLALVEAVAGWGRGLQRRGQLAGATRRLEALIGEPSSPTSTAPLSPKAVIDLPGLGLRLTPGMVLGVVGPSGCGKTALLETLAGLREAAPGIVRIDGEDLAFLPIGAMRPLVSLLAQDAPILSGTVCENLLLGRPDATDPDLWAALHCAVLDERVAAMPGGLDAWVGEGGARLSGGERRRLCLARALLRDAAFLLLDEPTEGLEAGTEAQVMERLRTWLRATGSGAVIVTHRAAPLQVCQRVVRMHAQGCPVDDFGCRLWQTTTAERQQ